VPDGTGALQVVTSEVINAASSPVTINPSNGFVEELIAPVDITVGMNQIPTYKIKLQDPYVRLLSATATGVVTTFTGSAVSCVVYVDNVKNNTDPSLTLIFDSSAPTATDSSILLAVTLANSTAL